MSSSWHLTCTPVFVPISVSSDAIVSNALTHFVISTIIIMLKYSWTIVCDMSRMFIWLSARYVHTLAMIPTVSLPTTVIMALVISFEFFMLFVYVLQFCPSVIS